MYCFCVSVYVYCVNACTGAVFGQAGSDGRLAHFLAKVTSNHPPPPTTTNMWCWGDTGVWLLSSVSLTPVKTSVGGRCPHASEYTAQCDGVSSAGRHVTPPPPPVLIILPPPQPGRCQVSVFTAIRIIMCPPSCLCDATHHRQLPSGQWLHNYRRTLSLHQH